MSDLIKGTGASGIAAIVFKGRPGLVKLGKSPQRWYFRLVDDSNREVLAQSEAYRDREKAVRTASRLAHTVTIEESD